VINDRRERVEKGERILARLSTDGLREQGGGQRAGRDDRGAIGQGVDPLTHEVDVGVRGDRLGHGLRECIAVDRQCRPRRHAVPVGLTHDQRAERAHFLMQQPDGIRFGVVRTEAV